jgi:heme/copper-type cytochrome/quinol oxidase subunit 4
VAALTNVFGYDDERRTSRYLCITVFGILFLIFTIIFGISLDKWDESMPGRCYNTKGIAASGSKHPLGDIVYVAFTCFYLMVTLGGAIEYSIGDTKKHVFRRFSIIQLSAIQYPIHLYMIITMRESNANLLEGNSENEWGFAQIVALVLLASTLIECVRGVKGTYSRAFVLMRSLG